MINQPESASIEHTYLGKNIESVVPWWLLERLVLLDYVDLGCGGYGWVVTAAGVRFLERCRKDDLYPQR